MKKSNLDNIKPQALTNPKYLKCEREKNNKLNCE